MSIQWKATDATFDTRTAAPPSSARPRSATAPLTAIVGLAAAVAAIALVRLIDVAPYLKSLIIVFAALIAMAVVDLGLFRTNRNASTGLAPRPLRPLDAARVIRKLAGFWATIAVLAAIYWLLPEYGGDYFAPAWSAARLLAPWVFIAAPFYVAYVDRRQLQPEDAYAQIGAFLIDRRRPDTALMGQHARGWLVKGFFLPLMFVITTNDIDALSKASFVIHEFRDVFDRLYDSFFLIDVLFASIGYLCTLRLFDTQIRSAEPTAFGWVICLVCYPPMWSLFEAHYLTYEADNFYWGNLLYGDPVLYALWGSAILLLVGIYASATVAFGLRFSNLTHRGIITSGPYRWVKHPAYVAKNLSFWLISIPFLSNQGPLAAVKACILLLGLNAIYAFRAWTEERHLSQDPAYEAYRAFIREHGLVARLKQVIFGSPAGARAVG